jgi:sucrose-6F-phosphate phosphohydrolase
MTMASSPLLLCTDLDRTLIPNGPEPESPGARERFRELVQQPQVTLAYVTGRHLALTEEAIKLYNLPLPDFIIGDVGSTIYQRVDGQWQLWQAWEDEITPDWAGNSRDDIAALFRDVNALQLQEPAKQNHHKLSYYTPLHIDQKQLTARMALTLDAAGIKASLISSIDEPAAIGLLDILPARANKRRAIEFLMAQQGFTLEQTVFAGDSGNDIPVLTSPINSVLVANATAEVVAQAQQQAALQGSEASLYCATGGYLNMNGNYSAGILEGVVHYIPDAKRWLS